MEIRKHFLGFYAVQHTDASDRADTVSGFSTIQIN